MQSTKLDTDMWMGMSRLISGTAGRKLIIRAWGYGNETEVGIALKQCKTPRSEIFVTVHDFDVGADVL
jgi:diketogulonate reductase-like aldo/keto reductase